jgi:hypothetical protein
LIGEPTQSSYTAEDERILVTSELISAGDLEALRSEARAAHTSAIPLLIEKGLYTKSQVDWCIETERWANRRADDHRRRVMSEPALAACREQYARDGYFTIPHFLGHEELYALDRALDRMILANGQDNRGKQFIGGPVLYTEKAMVALIGHPALTRIARALLGADVVQGKYLLKLDDPFRYTGIIGHTHAEMYHDCLSGTLFMFIYMDASGPGQGALRVIPGSHRFYERNSEGRTVYRGQVLDPEVAGTTRVPEVHDRALGSCTAPYESLSIPGNTLVVLSPFLWHAVEPVTHRRRLVMSGFFDATALTRDFVMKSSFFGQLPYDLRSCDLSLLDGGQRELLSIHLDREGWLARRGLLR